MNSMLIIASLIAVAVATPMHRGLVTPGAAGPAPIIIEPTQPIVVAPTPIIDGPTVPIVVAPTPIVDDAPISIGGAIIDFEHVEDIPVEQSPVTNTGTPLVQIILNINAAGELIAAPVANPSPAPVVTEVIAPGPVNVVDGPVVDEPVVVSPIVVVTPEVGPVNIVDGAEDVAIPEIVSPVAVGTPVLPTPVAVLPDMLN